jgi:hypothetical protein
MNKNIFNSARFNSVVRKYWFENRKTLTLRLATLFGVMLLTFAIWGIGDGYSRHITVQEAKTASMNNTEDAERLMLTVSMYQQSEKTHPNFPLMAEAVIAVWVIFFIGSYVGSTLSEHADSKEERITFYLHPASQFEKYLVRWIVVVPIFAVAAMVSFVLCDLIRTGIVSMCFPDTPGTYMFNYASAWRQFWNVGYKVWLLIGLYFCTQSLFMVGSVFFRKNVFIKTCVSLLVLACVLFFIESTTGNITELGQTTSTDETFRIENYNAMDLLFPVSTVLVWLFTAFNWVLAYLRMKENDVINRLA